MVPEKPSGFDVKTNTGRLEALNTDALTTQKTGSKNHARKLNGFLWKSPKSLRSFKHQCLY